MKDRQPTEKTGFLLWFLITAAVLATAVGTDHGTKREDCYRESPRPGCTTR